MRTLFAALLVTALTSRLPAQRDSTHPRLDSLALDTLFNGPAYTFTGTEDTLLLARAFEETYRLGLGEGGKIREPGSLCLAVGRLHSSDAPASVLRVLADHHPRVRPASSCRPEIRGGLFTRLVDSASGESAWILTIIALSSRSGDTIAVHSSHYVAPLWAAGWVCDLARRGRDWRVVRCSMTWIS